jgi:Ca2+-transporting ATPase
MSVTVAAPGTPRDDGARASAKPSGASVTVRIRSAVPGRFRLWVPGLYHNEEMKRAIEAAFEPSSARRASVNLVSGTLLVHAPEDSSAEALLTELQSIVERFSQQHAVPLHELERRSRQRPIHFARRQRARSASASGQRGRARLRSSRGAAGARGVGSLEASLLELPRSLLALVRGRRPPDEARGEEQPSHPWHALDVELVSDRLGVSLRDGLGAREAEVRLERYLGNTLPALKKRSELSMFIDQFKELPVLLLAGSTVLSMLTGGVADGVVILGVILINGVIGYVTEATAERTIASLTRGDEPEVEALRGGRLERVPLEALVPGDVIVLRPGQRVPVDGRVLEARELSIDESALTGESMPVSKNTATIVDPGVPLADRHNMVYRGTLVTGGSGRALVVATGAATQVGQLQAMVGEVERRETPMQKQLRELGERTVVIAGVVCGGVFLLGLVRGQALGTMLRTAVSLAVAAVPEGLPTVAITTLAIGIRRMKERHVLVRRLDAIETLGAVQVLCFDKTGTITHNRMRLVQLGLDDQAFTLEAGRVSGEAGELSPERAPALAWLLRVGALCSDALLVANEPGLPAPSGSPTECALVDAALALGVDVEALRREHPTLRVEHRSEARQWMATWHQTSRGRLVAVKGSPLAVLDLCQRRLCDGEPVPLSDDDRKSIRRLNERMAGDALRVLGMAYAERGAGELEAPQDAAAGEPAPAPADLVWLGLAGLADPPREGLPELIAKFRRAGVRSVMITGDQSATAYAIAKQIGLAEDGELGMLDSVELDRMDPELLAELAQRIQVFSRVSPRHKLRIVQALQKAGLVVAMTGDGINDCPALKAADIGVAMGGAGASVARDVADMVLERDDLGAMLIAIEQGRVIHADIKKAVRFILSTNLSEIMLTFLSVAAGFGEGMSPMQLLWINLVSDIFPELALALQPGESDVLLRPPRDSGARMFSQRELRHIAIEGAFLTAGALAVYTYGIRRYGLSTRARSVSFVALSAAQLLHAFSTRSEKNHIFGSEKPEPNPYLPVSVVGGIALTVLMQMVPTTRRWLGSGAMPIFDWAVATVGAIGPLLANEMVKAARFAPARLTAQAEPPRLPAAAE